jgi:hypothetical protein
MKRYTIHFKGRKLRAKLGAHWSEPAVVDEWEQSIQSNEVAAVWHLTDFVYPRHGIPGVRFCHVPTEPGLFRASQHEDSRGGYNTKGRYLDLVDVQITMSRNEPAIRVGTLNLRPEH